MSAFILAGGEGKRLHDLTASQAKPALPFGGHYRIIDFTLSNCFNSGIQNIGVLTQYKARTLIQHLQDIIRSGKQYNKRPLAKMDILPAQQYSKKQYYQGTADAVFQNIQVLKQQISDYVIILGGDHVYQMDYTDMLLQHIQTGADLSVACTEVPVKEACRYGIMCTNDELGVTHFIEKPSALKLLPKCSKRDNRLLASIGVYIFSKDFLFDTLRKDALSPYSSHDFGKDVIPACIGKAKVYAFPFRDSHGKPAYWRDVGTLDAYWQAHMDLCNNESSIAHHHTNWPIHSYQPLCFPTRLQSTCRHSNQISNALLAGGVVVKGSAKIEHSVSSFHCHIDHEARIKNSVLLPNVRVGKACRLYNAIVDNDCVIPDGMVIGVDAERDRQYFKISDSGIVLVTKERLADKKTAHWLTH